MFCIIGPCFLYCQGSFVSKQSKLSQNKMSIHTKHVFGFLQRATCWPSSICSPGSWDRHLQYYWRTRKCYFFLRISSPSPCFLCSCPFNTPPSHIYAFVHSFNLLRRSYPMPAIFSLFCSRDTKLHEIYRCLWTFLFGKKVYLVCFCLVKVL